MNDFLVSWQPKALGLLRIVTGFLFFWHGTQKLFGFPPSGGGSGEMPTIIVVAGVLELVGGFLVMVGLFTNWTSFVMSGLMAVAYWMSHGGNSKYFAENGLNALLPIVNRGELAVLYCFVFLYLFFAGGGAFSIDNLKKKKE